MTSIIKEYRAAIMILDKCLLCSSSSADYLFYDNKYVVNCFLAPAGRLD